MDIAFWKRFGQSKSAKMLLLLSSRSLRSPPNPQSFPAASNAQLNNQCLSILISLQKCREAVELKKCLLNLKLTYAMLYPAKLHVTASGQAQFFESAREAFAWLDRNEQAL